MELKSLLVQKKRYKTIRLAVTDHIEEEIEQFAKRKAKMYGSRNQRHPAVFCTWYYYGLTVTYEDVRRNLEIEAEQRLTAPFLRLAIARRLKLHIAFMMDNHRILMGLLYLVRFVVFSVGIMWPGYIGMVYEEEVQVMVQLFFRYEIDSVPSENKFKKNQM